MPSSYTRNSYHLVFSTKRREPLITPDIEERLHPFIGGILRDLDCRPVAINGARDHLHVLVQYPAKLSHADLARHVKARSSKWINECFSCSFAWQEGYGGFTVSRSSLATVRTYIENQKEHHRRFDFETEFTELLRRHGVEFDPDVLFG